MDPKARKIREKITALGPRRARQYVLSFDLQPEETACIIAREADGKSIQQIAQERNVSQETVKRRRKTVFKKSWSSNDNFVALY